MSFAFRAFVTNVLSERKRGDSSEDEDDGLA